MTQIEHIQAEIEALSQEDCIRLREWFLEKDWSRWDQQLEADISDGKLDFLADPRFLKEVWLGEIWEPYEINREYIVWGIPGQPVTPQFKGEGRAKMRIKMSVHYTEDLGKPRDIR